MSKKDYYPTDTDAQLTERECDVIRRAVRRVVDSVLKRERSRLKRSVVLHRMNIQMDYERAMYIAAIANRKS